MSRHVICRVEELPPGARKLVTIDGRTIGIFNVHGSYHALLNRCPHLAAPLCQGVVTGLITASEPYKKEFSRDGEILRCPWHGWEFDITNGRSVYNPHRVRVRSYKVLVEAQGAGQAGADVPDRDGAGVSDPDGAGATAPAGAVAADAACPAFATIGPDDPDPSLETFPVAVEQRHVVLYVGESGPARRPPGGSTTT